MNKPKLANFLAKKREITWTPEKLIEFEDKVKEVWESGTVRGPVHLSKGNEEQLIEIFQYVHPEDWVFSTWRNHYHALLHGISENWLMDEIKRGRSMKIMNRDYRFATSAIVGGIIPHALGVAMALKRNDGVPSYQGVQNNSAPGSDRKVWCFVGDMTFETGVFHECYKYAKNFDLPIQFIVEDNNLSTNTPTDETWGVKQEIPNDYSESGKLIYYQYERGFPHHGSGSWVLF
jgi:pyruvate dehydrogenase E1 component alpha subunit|tara:strand:+ start:408 stop:1106 length:699 start_codon:yes stop_codon:yes gene_type:complete